MGGSVLAADAPVAKTPVYTKAPPRAAECSPYWSLFGGWNSVESINSYSGVGLDDPRSLQFKDGYVVGGAVGRCVPGWNWLRIEGELSYRRNGLSSVTVAPEGTASRSGRVTALALMANAWADFNVAPNVTVHAGGGIGAARVGLRVSNISVTVPGPFPVNDSDTVFAFQLGAGAAWHFMPNVALTLDYRYFHAMDPTFRGAAGLATYSFSDDYQAHSIMVGLRGKFTTGAP